MNQNNSAIIGSSGTLLFPIPSQAPNLNSGFKDEAPDDLPNFKDFEEMAKFLSYDSENEEECITTTVEVEEYKCESCSRKFTTKSGWRKHCLCSHANLHTTWECNRCHKYFWNIRMMKNHEEHCQEGKEFKCQFCGVCFALEKDLTIHLRLHASENFYLCSKCHQTFENNRAYRHHVRTCANPTEKSHKNDIKEKEKRKELGENSKVIKKVPAPKTKRKKAKQKVKKVPSPKTKQRRTKLKVGRSEIECIACNKTFSNVNELEDHIQCVHSLNKYFNCPECHRSYSKYRKLRKHIQSKHNSKKKSLKCDVCHRMFTRANHLATHKRRHMTMTIETCRVCFMRFETAKELEDHEKEHFGTNYCIICDKKFSYRGHFLLHINKHYNKKHTCPKCSKVFSSYDIFKIHLLMHKTHLNSEKRKSFRCELCNLWFSYKTAYETHVKNYHRAVGTEGIRCDICQCLFQNESLLSAHMEVHSKKEYNYECEICYRKFTQRPSLNRHMKRHTGEKPFKCAFCRVRFSRKDTLKEHLRMHTKEKPYECQFCKKTFGQRTALNAHKTNVHYVVKE